jgi:hypothetical protein
MDPKILRKKSTIAHSIPDDWPIKKKQYDSSGILDAGSSSKQKNYLVCDLNYLKNDL